MAFDDTTKTNRSGMIWVSAASCSIASTRHLLDHDLHFPMHLLALQLFCVLAFDTVQWLFSQSERPFKASPLQNSTVCHRLLYTFCFSGALVCGYQAMHHWHNLPIVVIVLTLDWRPIWTACKISTGKGIRQIAVRILLLLFGIVLMLLFDFRASTVGIIMMLQAATFKAVGDFLVSWREDALIGGTEPCLETSTPGTTDFLGALVLALFWCRFREQQFFDIRPYSPLTSDLPTLALNLICSTLAFNSRGHVFGYSPPSQEHPIIRLSLFIFPVCLVTIANAWSSSSPPLISPWQFIGLAIVTMVLLPIGSSGDAADECPDLEKEVISTKGRLDCSEDTAIASTDRTGTRTYSGREGLFLLLILFASGAMLALELAQKSARSVPATAVLDQTFDPARSLDIVIARYDEPASEVARHVDELHSLTAVQSLEPRVLIYDKSENNSSSTFLSELHRLVTVPLAETAHFHMKNIGRETDTYLEHITSHWSDLARHTIFMQASVHYAPRAYLRRIRDYFVPETGFLSLAESTNFCSSCDECHDRDWSESPSVISSVFEDFNHEAACGDVLLTYRGQFIASAARIRGNRLESYQEWLHRLRSPESFLHSLPYTQDVFSRKNDSMSAPRVGFTLERMWGVMMQCNGRGIATQCPTLLSSAICPPAVCGRITLGDCQCLDDS